tara:strand:+ start:284 stop:817 length:534 start_codon:yes stop_codon:yes gene_type:complete
MSIWILVILILIGLFGFSNREKEFKGYIWSIYVVRDFEGNDKPLGKIIAVMHCDSAENLVELMYGIGAHKAGKNKKPREPWGIYLNYNPSNKSSEPKFIPIDFKYFKDESSKEELMNLIREIDDNFIFSDDYFCIRINDFGDEIIISPQQFWGYYFTPFYDNPDERLAEVDKQLPPN